MPRKKPSSWATAGADSVAITMGASTATDALKHALAMGIGEAKLIDSSGVSGDMWTTGLHPGCRSAEGDVDLVITGKVSVDENSSSVFIGVACKLASPAANVVRIVEIAAAHHGRTHCGRRAGDGVAAAARGDQRGQGDQRPALPQLYGHPQGQPLPRSRSYRQLA